MPCAIIGEIKSSKAIGNRPEFLMHFRTMMVELNNRYQSHVITPFSINGEEGFSGLLQTAQMSFDCIDYTERRLWPIQLRIGIGVGEAPEGSDPEVAYGRSSPAYKRARNVLEALKQKGAIEADAAYFSGKKEDLLINALLYTCSEIQSSWTTKQREYIYFIEDSNTKQMGAANHFGVEQSTVSRALKYARYPQYRYSMQMLENYARSGR